MRLYRRDSVTKETAARSFLQLPKIEPNLVSICLKRHGTPTSEQKKRWKRMLVTRHAWLNYRGCRSVLICNPRNKAVSPHASRRCKRFIGNRFQLFQNLVFWLHHDTTISSRQKLNLALELTYLYTHIVVATTLAFLVPHV